MQLRSELVDELYDRIMQKLILEKKYRDPDYSARQLAQELGTNTRYVSAVVSLRYQDNYSTLVNDFRIREAAYMLTDKRWADLNVEDIGLAVGFSNRQSFYASFYRMKGITPREYRLLQADKFRK